MTRLPEWVSGNIFIRPNPGKAGDVVAEHAHNFDHTVIVFTGRVRIVATYPDGTIRDQEFSAPAHCLIRAAVEHELTFLEDGEFWCVYAHRDPQGAVSQEFTGWSKAYE